LGVVSWLARVFDSALPEDKPDSIIGFVPVVCIAIYYAYKTRKVA
jgi:hypothetical protein